MVEHEIQLAALLEGYPELLELDLGLAGLDGVGAGREVCLLPDAYMEMSTA